MPTNRLEQNIARLLLEKSGNLFREEDLRSGRKLQELGLTTIEIYDLIVQLEDVYGISIVESGETLAAKSLSELTDLVRTGLRQQSEVKIPNWKDSFEGLVFSGQLRSLRTPLSIHLDPSFKCNMRCVFCYDSSGSDHGMQEMSTPELFGIIDQCRDLDVVDITFGGGEPFLRPDFLDLFRHAKQQLLRCFILTNGSLISREVAEELAASFDTCFDMIQVSLDGPTAEVHEKQRGVRGGFAKTMAGIKNLQAVGIAPVINSVFTRHNYAYIPQMLDFLMENGVTSYRLLRLHPLGRGRDDRFYEEWKVPAKEGQKVLDFLNRKRDELIGEFHIANDHACLFHMNEPEVRKKIQPLPGKDPCSYACGAGTTKLAIAPDGSVFPCSYMYEFPELRIGSVRDNTIKELWDRDELWAMYRNPLSPSGKCRGCEYLHYCKTGCRIVAYSYHGDMGGPDAGCNYLPGTDAAAGKKTCCG